MPFLRREDPEVKAARIAAEMTAKVDPGGSVSRWLADLNNEQASARASYTSMDKGSNDTARWAADHYVVETSERLERDRPTSRRNPRSVDADRGRPGGFFTGGIFAAGRRDADGERPYLRWPSETQPSQGGGCSIPGCTCG